MLRQPFLTTTASVEDEKRRTFASRAERDFRQYDRLRRPPCTGHLKKFRSFDKPALQVLGLTGPVEAG